MLLNPFTPTRIASAPDEFFGRAHELEDVARSIQQGSVAIQGPVGIGKSSLLAHTRLQLEGFGSEHRWQSVATVINREVDSLDSAARMLLEEFAEVDEQQQSIQLSLGSIFQVQSAEIYRNFVEGRHLAALNRLLSKEVLQRIEGDYEGLILAIDEADKNPALVARLVRSVVTQTQQAGVNDVRFVIAGVTPFVQEMFREDPGVARFIYRTVVLAPMSVEEATDLLETKLRLVVEDASARGEDHLRIDPHTIARIVSLSGGHPHLLQLLGSFLIEHENSYPDGLLDSADLSGALSRICYDNRGFVYDTVLHQLDWNECLYH